MKNKLQKIINYIIIVLSSILYIFMMFKSDIVLGTGRKELENMLILAIPCFMLLVYSLNLKNKKERQQILVFYLILYTLALLGFTFANFRNSELITKGIMEKGYNLIPFHTIITLFTSPIGIKVALYNIIGNFLMLTPLSILLPLINDKFKRITNYFITIIIVCVSIELTQYITRIGNLDIDDFILNISGSFILYIIFIKTKLYNLGYKIFYEYTIPTKKQNVIYYCLLFLIVLVYIWYAILIYNREKQNKVDFTNLICISENKTYIGSTATINYYTECEFSGYIIKGNQTIPIEDIVKTLSSTIEKYTNELKLIKEDAFTNVEVKLSTNSKKIIHENSREKVYFIDIESINFTRNGIHYYIETQSKENELAVSYLDTLVTLVKQDINLGYVIQKGDYYNILSCLDNFYSDEVIYEYIVPKDYELNKNSCSKYQED